MSRPCIYPWNDYAVGGSFTIPVGPDETPRDIQRRLVSRTRARKLNYGERWKTKQLWNGVKVTRLA